MDSFDYKKFVENLAEQARNLIPKDIDDTEKNNLVNIIYKFGVLCYEGIDKDEKRYTLEQKQYLTQILCEWIFHKWIDLSRANIKGVVRDEILKEIAFVIFEVVKMAFEKELSEEQIVQVVEHHVRKQYVESLLKYKDKKIITQEVFDAAMAQSNIDIMAEEEQKEKSDNKTVSDEFVKNAVNRFEEPQKDITLSDVLNGIANIFSIVFWLSFGGISLLAHHFLSFLVFAVVSLFYIYKNSNKIKNFIIKYNKIIVVILLFLILKNIYPHIPKIYIIFAFCLIIYLIILFLIYIKYAKNSSINNKFEAIVNEILKILFLG